MLEILNPTVLAIVSAVVIVLAAIALWAAVTLVQALVRLGRSGADAARQMDHLSSRLDEITRLTGPKPRTKPGPETPPDDQTPGPS